MAHAALPGAIWRGGAVTGDERGRAAPPPPLRAAGTQPSALASSGCRARCAGMVGGCSACYELQEMQGGAYISECNCQKASD